MTAWREIKLKEVCDRITVGHVGSMATEYKEKGIPFLRSLNINPFRLSYDNLKFIDANFHEKLKKSALKPGDVAVVRTGYPGTACVIPKSLPASNCSDLVIVRPGKELNSYFLAAIFNSTFGKDLVAGNLVGAAQQHFNITVAKELKLKIPPKAEQDKIAAVLATYDDLIENNQRRISLLEKMAGELYREWFVRLRFPGYAQVKAEKGVPNKWEFIELGKLCKLIKRGIAPSYLESSANLVINQRCIRNGAVDLTEARGHESSTPDEKLIKFGDVLINSTGVGTLGRVAFFDDERTDLTCDTHVTICRPNIGVIDIYYFGSVLLSLQNYFENMAVGSTGQAELGRDLIAKTKILRPSSELQESFARIVEPLWKQKRLFKRQLLELIKARDLLLPRLISGKLSVKSLDIHFPPRMQEVA
jgi:type I restriction enzyme S subunit